MVPLVVVCLLLLTMGVPALNTALKQKTPVDSEVAAFIWMRDNLARDAKVIAPLEEGHLVTYYAQRKNMIDDQFYLVNDIEQRYKENIDLFTTPFQTYALGLAEKYQAQYIVVTPFTQQKYGLSQLRYYTIECLERVYRKDTLIYKLKCTLQK